MGIVGLDQLSYFLYLVCDSLGLVVDSSRLRLDLGLTCTRSLRCQCWSSPAPSLPPRSWRSSLLVPYLHSCWPSIIFCILKFVISISAFVLETLRSVLWAISSSSLSILPILLSRYLIRSLRTSSSLFTVARPVLKLFSSSSM